MRPPTGTTDFIKELETLLGRCVKRQKPGQKKAKYITRPHVSPMFPQLRYPVIGRAEVQANRTTTVRVTFSAKNKE
jgi:hypothetical protein